MRRPRAAAMTDTAAPRDRLVALRDDALRQLAEADVIDAGLLALVAHVGAALAALDAAQESAATSKCEHRCRGGDPHAEQRARRDDAIRSLARLIGNGSSASRQARELAMLLSRFRPMPNESRPERRLMREVID